MSGKGGFTLIEVLAVVVIIGLLAGLVLGISTAANRKAAETQARAEIEEIKMGLERGRVQQGAYFSSTNTNMNHVSFAALTNAPYSVLLTFPFIDPWGRPYIYVRRGDFQHTLYSHGHDESNPATNIR